MGASVPARVKRCLRAAPGSIPPPSPAPDFERHRRKCAVCNHPEREAIEELFIYWHSAGSIQDHFNLPDWSTLYRHAHAAGLYERRRHNIRAVLDHLLESADGVEATPMSIVAAVRAYACLTDSGAWLEPAKRVLYTTTYVSNASRQPTAEAVPPAPSSAEAAVSAVVDEVEEESLRNEGSAHASYSERLEGRGSASTPPRAPAVAGATSRRPSAEDSALVPSSSLAPAQSSPAAAGGGEAVVSHSASSALSVRGSRATPHDSPDAARGKESVAVPATSLPKAAVPPSASSALSVHGSPATDHGSRSAPHDSPAPPPALVDTNKSREATDLRTSNLRPPISSNSNRQSPELEMLVSPSKQTTAPLSNRQFPPHAQRELPLVQKGAAKLPKR
jgi:hypothetical protein